MITSDKQIDAAVQRVPTQSSAEPRVVLQNAERRGIERLVTACNATTGRPTRQLRSVRIAALTQRSQRLLFRPLEIERLLGRDSAGDWAADLNRWRKTCLDHRFSG